MSSESVQEQRKLSKSFSLHLDNIQSESGRQVDFSQSSSSADHKTDLFERFISACGEKYRDSAEASDSSDDSIQQGRDSSASSRTRKFSKRRNSEPFLSNLNPRLENLNFEYSFLQKPKDNDFAHTLRPSQRSMLHLQERRKSTASELPGNEGRRKSCARVTLDGKAECEIYTTQIVRTLNSGRPVWL